MKSIKNAGVMCIFSRTAPQLLWIILFWIIQSNRDAVSEKTPIELILFKV